MNLLAPLFLSAALFIAVPIVLHLLRRRPRQPIAFPALRLLGAAVLREAKRHRILRRLLLACRCLVLGLLALAFAQPFFGGLKEPAPKARVVVLDNSFSMQAGSRWADLLKWAEGQIADLDSRDHCGIVVMNPKPAWLFPLNTDPATARVALRRALPGFTDSHYEPALRVAGEMLAGWPAKDREIIFVCDHQRQGWQGVDFSKPLPAGVKIRFPDVSPAPTRQAAIIGSRVIRSGAGMSIEVRIRQFVPEKDQRMLSVSIGEKVVNQQPVSLDVERPLKLEIPLQENLSSAQAVKVSLDADDVPPDDTSYTVLEEGSKLSILLSTLEMREDEVDFLSRALDATREEGIESFQINGLPEGEWPIGSIAILRGAEVFRPPHQKRLDAFLARGGAAWLILDGSPEQISWLKSQGVDVEMLKRGANQHLQNWDTEHPLLEPFVKGGHLMSLLSLQFQRGWALRGDALYPLASWSDNSTALAEVGLPVGRLFVTGFDFSRNTSSFPVSPAFVPFAHRAILWLADAERGRDVSSAIAGKPLELPEASGTWASVDSPRKTPEQQAGGSLIPMIPGVYRWQSTPETRLFAVNLPERESDLALWPMPSDWLSLSSKQDAPAISKIQNVSALKSANVPFVEISWWLFFAVLLFLLCEIMLANRTAI